MAGAKSLGLVLVCGALSLPGCKLGGERDSSDVAAAAQAACLQGGNRQDHICGPFNAQAVAKCLELGGGEPCRGERWSRKFHEHVVSRMADGASNCVEAGSGSSSKCGPFAPALVEACIAAKGGAPCVGNRWNKAFHERLLGRASAASSNDAVQEYGGIVAAPSSKRVLSSVPFLSQPTSNTCGPTSVAMVLRFFGRKGDIWDVNSRVPSTLQEPIANAAEFRRQGLHAQGTKTGTKALMMRMIDEGRPVVLHTFLTSEGHVVVVIGYDKSKGGFYIHDPWGEYLGYRGGYGGGASGGQMSFISWTDPNLMTRDGDIWISAADTKPFSF